MSALRWDVDGLDWPNRQASRFVEAGGLRWHVQCWGSGPSMLLLHGTGASTHSWRDLAPLLARDFTLIAPDLPGHGFTAMPPRGALTLPGMAEAVATLLARLDATPRWVVGHSAGAAVLARLCIDGRIAPHALVSLNGAFLPLGGTKHPALARVARLLTLGDVLPRVFAWRAADAAVVDQLLRRTGSTLDARGRDFYQRLARSTPQVSAALAMMAGWDPRPLMRDLPRLRTRLELIAGGNDGMIAPSEAVRVEAMVPGAHVTLLPGLGHLAHEERPAEVAGLIVALTRKQAEAA